MRFCQLLRHLAGLVQVFELQAHARGAFQPEDALRVLMVQHDQGRVVFVVARIKRARHRHLLEAGHHARGRDLPGRGNQRDGIAHTRPQRTGQLAPQHHAELARHQLLEHLGVGGGQVGHRAFFVGVNAAHQCALHVFATGQQGLGRHKGRCAHHVGVSLRFGQRAGRVGHGRPVGREDLDVRHHTEHAVAHLFLKAVHHAQHDDERRHPQGNAQHGHARDERDEAVAPRSAAGAGVAPAQSQFVRNLHGSAIVALGGSPSEQPTRAPPG